MAQRSHLDQGVIDTAQSELWLPSKAARLHLPQAQQVHEAVEQEVIARRGQKRQLDQEAVTASKVGIRGHARVLLANIGRQRVARTRGLVLLGVEEPLAERVSFLEQAHQLELHAKFLREQEAKKCAVAAYKAEAEDRIAWQATQPKLLSLPALVCPECNYTVEAAVPGLPLGQLQLSHLPELLTPTQATATLWFVRRMLHETHQ